MKFRFLVLAFLLTFGLSGAATPAPVAARHTAFRGDNLYDFYSRAMPQALRGYAADHGGLFPSPDEITGDPATDALLKGGYLAEYYQNPLAPGSRVTPQPLAEQMPGEFSYFSEVLPSSYAILVLKGDTAGGSSYSALTPGDVTPWIFRTDSNVSLVDDIKAGMVHMAVINSVVFSDTGRFNGEACASQLLNMLPTEIPKAQFFENAVPQVAASADLSEGTLTISIHAAAHPDVVLFRSAFPDFANFHRVYANWMPNEIAKKNLHTVQIALERYSTDNDGTYPSDLSRLLKLGYLTHMPANAFDPQNPMKAVPPDRLSTGDILYVPLYWTAAKANERPRGFVLGLIGPEGAKGTSTYPRIILRYEGGIDAVDGQAGKLPEIKSWDDVLREYARAQSLAK